MSWHFRRVSSFYFKLIGVPVGIFGGGVFGLIRSTEHNLRRLEELGPDFKLGRIAINEINEYRLDSNYIRK